ncbi:MAG: hypothetical protein ABSF99_07445 [Anaerolineales bacterium]|jgi:hypothetical protein
MNTFPNNSLSLIKRIALRRGALFGGILLLALFAFEIFNYSTTDFALTDMLGADLRVLGISWATILSIAFCGIDFAGLARLLTPEQGRDEPAEVWYLFGAWLLAAAMNAVLTWWGVAVAIRSHQELSTLVVGQSILTKVVPIFVAIMVWLIRVLIIGTFSMAGDRMFSLAENRQLTLGNAYHSRPSLQPSRTSSLPRPIQPAPVPFHPAPKPEPTYQPVGMSASSHNSDVSMRK